VGAFCCDRRILGDVRTSAAKDIRRRGELPGARHDNLAASRAAEQHQRRGDVAGPFTDEPDLEASCRPEMLAERQYVGQGLAGVVIAGHHVDHWNVCVIREFDDAAVLSYPDGYDIDVLAEHPCSVPN
jgi:hypothetical protein